MHFSSKVATKRKEETALFRPGLVFLLLTSLAFMHSNCAGQSPQSTSHSDSLRSCPSSRLCWLMWAQHSPLANISPYSEQTIGFLKSSKKPAFHAPVAERGETQPHRQVLGSKNAHPPPPSPHSQDYFPGKPGPTGP